MNNQKEEKNYTKEIITSASAVDVFSALSKEINLWWGEVDKPVSKIGDIFTISFGEASWTFRIIEYVPNSKITWECIGGKPEFNAEWIGDILYWNIETFKNTTKVNFLQVGLTPNMNCYDICAPTWDKFIMISLKSFVETGKVASF
ncbi:hypothetical protein Q4Q35_01920 [Flavivirga aquimarina]|uniref:SRPBCC domain-containing protein n=1 Tax=Flavivirga aquimarina TaxID=2027862 RepID=A0ABT8W618_9FLAO|nr:hypothetical protein [Flavivirga aquimarina]MDO5968553.1 hypothetical protein [Flavivirga aquimarina]